MVVVVVAVIVVVVVAEQKKEEKDTQNTQNKKKQRMKTDKKSADYWPFLALFQEKNSVLSYVLNSFWDDPFLFGLNSCMTQQNKGVVSKM